jgi:hypothetical protein
VLYYYQWLKSSQDEQMKAVTLDSIYKEIVTLKRDVAKITKNLLDELELRDEFILRMRDIDQEKSFKVADFEKHYGLKTWG